MVEDIIQDNMQQVTKFSHIITETIGNKMF